MGYSQYNNDLWSLPTFPGVFLLFSFYFQIGLLLSFPEMSQDSISLRAFCLWEPIGEHVTTFPVLAPMYPSSLLKAQFAQ